MVADEDTVAGLTENAEAAHLLGTVARALANDIRLMPGEIVDFIQNETELALNSTKYAGGAQAVLDHMRIWDGIFYHRYSKTGR